MHMNRLPAEVVLYICNELPSWKDRLEFATSCKYVLNTNLAKVNVPEVDLANENNLLRLKLARTLYWNCKSASEVNIERAVSLINACGKMRTIVIKHGFLTNIDIKLLLEALVAKKIDILIMVRFDDWKAWNLALAEYETNDITIDIGVEN